MRKEYDCGFGMILTLTLKLKTQLVLIGVKVRYDTMIIMNSRYICCSAEAN